MAQVGWAKSPPSAVAEGGFDPTFESVAKIVVGYSYLSIFIIFTLMT